jgi:hypothetical protein
MTDLLVTDYGEIELPAWFRDVWATVPREMVLPDRETKEGLRLSTRDFNMAIHNTWR